MSGISSSWSLPARAQSTLPDKPVRLIVPNGAGGVADLTARTVGAALSERYGLSDLRLYAVVGVGLERVVWQRVALTG